MTCKKEIINLMSDNVERTTYDIFKKLSFSYGTTHRYVKELLASNFLKETRKYFNKSGMPKIFYKIKNVS